MERHELSTQGMVLSGVLCTDPNGGEGGIWGGGGGLTFDPDETVQRAARVLLRNRQWRPCGGTPTLDANGFPTDDDYYESLVKVEADPTTTATNQNSNGWGMKSSTTSHPITSTRSTTLTRISAPARRWCCPTRPAFQAIRT